MASIVSSENRQAEHDGFVESRRSPCLLRYPGPPDPVASFQGVRIDDRRLADVIDQAAPLLILYGNAIHGEGPIWDQRKNRLVWSDVTGRRVLAWHPDGHVEVVLDATPFINGNAFDLDGELVHCEHLRRCISRSDGDGVLAPIVTHYQGRRLNTPNDITTAVDGAIWFTDPTFGLLIPSQGCLADPDLDHRSVYRYDPRSGCLQRMADFDQPNGIFFSPSGDTLYVSDTSRSIGGPTHDILAFDVDRDQKLSNRRLFCQTEHGVPDGFLVDRRGWVWTTAGDGIHVYAVDGVRLGFIPTPQTCANCALGGESGNRLFIAAESFLFALDLRQPSI